MATTRTRKPTTKTTAAKKTSEPIQPDPIEEVVEPVSQEPVEAEKPAPVKKRQAIARKRIPNDEMIIVISSCPNTLVYSSDRERLEWDAYGDEQEMPFESLRTMKGMYPRFFKDNWICLADTADYTKEEIYTALGVYDFYKNFVEPADVMTLLNSSADVIEEKMKTFSPALRRTIFGVATQKRNEGEFDSFSKYEVIRNLANVVGA